MVTVVLKTVVTMRLNGSCVSHSRTDVAVRDLRTTIDEPAERGGTNQGLTPTETLMASLLACTNVITHKVAQRNGAYRAENLGSVMCRTLISVDWQGYLYDCDFNQMLGLPLKLEGRKRSHLSELIGRDVAGNPIAVRDHCCACTAGQGSSCGGALHG